MIKKYLFTVFLIFISGTTFSQIYFKESASDKGVAVSPGITSWGNGITFHDYNNDGWDDITLTTETGEPLRFFKNMNGSFTEEVLLTPSITYQTKQVNWVDFDNDGDKDLFVTSNTDGNRLYENTGGMVLQDISVAAGFPITNMYTLGASWGDYNNDGYLDVFLSNYDVLFAIPNYLYKNNGNGTFTDVSGLVDLSTESYLSFCSAFFDFNNDGYQDIFVANDRVFNPNFLYKNNGDNTFTEIGLSSGAGIFMNAMSATIADFNRDGWFDIYITNTSEGNVFLKNNGNETFTDIAGSSGTLFNSFAWGSVFLDVNNDMDLDLYVSGMLNANPMSLPYEFYENNDNETFSIPSGSGFDIDDSSSFSNAIGDFNNDGKFDIVVSNNDDANIFLWENQTTTTNNWLKINLEGTTSNRDGIGSVIEIGINGEKQFRYTLCGEGYLSQNSKSEIIGLGTNTEVDYVKVTWLSGIEDVINDVAANQVLNILEGTGTLDINDPLETKIKLYPNPVSDVLFIDASKAIQLVSIYNVLGQSLSHQRFDDRNLKINVASLPSGTYIVQISTNEAMKSFKLVKD